MNLCLKNTIYDGEVGERFLKNSSYQCVFEKKLTKVQLKDKYNPQNFERNLILQLNVYIYIRSLYHNNMERFEEQNSGTPSTLHHPPPTIKIKKVTAFISEILIKYKRIKWTLSCQATLLLPGGQTSILFYFWLGMQTKITVLKIRLFVYVLCLLCLTLPEMILKPVQTCVPGGFEISGLNGVFKLSFQ